MRKSSPACLGAFAPRWYWGERPGPRRPASSRRLHLWVEKGRQALQVEAPADQICLLPDTQQPTPAEAPQPMPVLALAEELLDLLAGPLRQLVQSLARAFGLGHGPVAVPDGPP